MLTYQLIYETGASAGYEYCPEGNENAKGLVSVSKKDGTVSIIELSPSDEARVYALKLFRKLRQFHSIGEYPKHGTVSWY